MSVPTVLEKIIAYEAVHAIHSWDDLRRRLAPADRRCFAFFHPRLVGLTPSPDQLAVMAKAWW